MKVDTSLQAYAKIGRMGCVRGVSDKGLFNTFKKTIASCLPNIPV